MPETVSASMLVVFTAVYFLAGAIKGTFGVGFPTAAIAIMAMFVDARSAIAFAIIPMVLINAWQIFRSGNVAQTWKRNWMLIVSMMITIAYFSLRSAEVSLKNITLLLGIFTAAFAAISLWKSPPPLAEKFNKPVQVVTGLLSGVFGGLCGIWAPPILVYLSSRRVQPLEFLQIMGVVLFIGSSILLIGYWQIGTINMDMAPVSLALIVPAIGGFAVGELLRAKLSVEQFQKLVLMFFVLMGLNLVRRAVVM